MGEGMEHMEEGFSHPRYPPRDYSGPADRGPRDYEGHNPERGRGRGFVSPCVPFARLFCCISLSFFTEILTSHLLAILCPNGITVDASLLCSYLLMLRNIMWMMIMMMTLCHTYSMHCLIYIKVT